MEGKISNQHYLHSYLSYIKLSKTIERNLLLIDNLKNYLPGGKVEEGRKITKPQDLVRLYDIIIQVCYEILLTLSWNISLSLYQYNLEGLFLSLTIG